MEILTTGIDRTLLLQIMARMQVDHRAMIVTDTTLTVIDMDRTMDRAMDQAMIATAIVIGQESLVG